MITDKSVIFIIGTSTPIVAVKHQIISELNYSMATSLHEDPQFSYAPGSYVDTMGILYRRTKQLVNSSRCYVSTKPVRRLLNQGLLDVIIF